jgi:hypothetical protein
VITPGSDRVSTGNPLSRKTSIIRWLTGITIDVNVDIPCRWAAAASWASRIVAIPWPCHASETTNATSARSHHVRM